ncbi:MAG TPA: 30S ribosome-binding factor RbfA [Vicinamibacterales bacterium]|nr:30S ribosome-binding factor RbfA [Vicinamibacterales bacterium]
MGQGSRPERVADLIRAEVTTMIAREVHDPGIGFVTVTRVQVSNDLQHARIFYTSLGDATARKSSARALERATGFMRSQLGRRLRLRRAPELEFQFDESVGHQDRVAQLLKEIADEHAHTPAETDADLPEPDER